MKSASLNRVKVALLRELEVTFQSHFHQHLSEVITDLRVHNVEGSGVAKVDEILSVIRTSGILQLMSGAEFVPLCGAIDRLTTGEYGRCVRCGRDIPVIDLERNPTVQFCLRCHPASQRFKGRPSSQAKHG